MEEQLQKCPLTTKQLVDRVLVFVEKFTETIRVGKSGLYTYQKLFAKRIIESVLENDGDTVTALFSRQSGKTETVADVAVALAVILPVLTREFPGDVRLSQFSAGFWVGIFAPVYDQSAISFGRMRSVAVSDESVDIMEDPEIGVELSINRSDELGFSNGSVVRSKSASPDTKIEGKTYHLVIVDEAQKVLRSKVEKEIMPMLAATNGTMVKIGTAWESRGGFHTDITFNTEAYRQGGKRNHFEFDYKMVVAEKKAAFKRDGNPFHTNYEKFVNKTIRRLGGQDNEEFKMNFRLLWSESRVIAFKPAILLGGRELNLCLNLPRRSSLQVAGLDVAKSNDSSVLTVLDVDTNPIVDISKFGTPHDKKGNQEGEDEQNLFYRKTVIGLLDMQGSFEGDSGQYQQVIDFLAKFNVSLFVIDASGMGDPVYERLSVLLHGIEVEPFVYNTPSKSDLYKYYLQEWYAGRMKYAASEATQDMSSFRKFESQHLDLDKTQSGNYISCEAPEDGYDDFPDSCALAVWAERLSKKEAMPVVEVTRAGPAANLTPEQDDAARLRHGRSYRYHRGRGAYG